MRCVASCVPYTTVFPCSLMYTTSSLGTGESLAGFVAVVYADNFPASCAEVRATWLPPIPIGLQVAL